MTSIAQLLSPLPDATPPTMVLRDQPEDDLSPSPPSIYQSVASIMSPGTVSSPQTSGHSPTPTIGSDHGDGDNGQSDGQKRYSKRELSTSKRAAQNRAAQRAFRQRREGYIKKLEGQVQSHQVLSENFKAVQAENDQLRKYVINLHSRLLESQHEVSPPPCNVDGLSPGKVCDQHLLASSASPPCSSVKSRASHDSVPSPGIIPGLDCMAVEDNMAVILRLRCAGEMVRSKSVCSVDGMNHDQLKHIRWSNSVRSGAQSASPMLKTDTLGKCLS